MKAKTNHPILSSNCPDLKREPTTIIRTTTINNIAIKPNKPTNRLGNISANILFSISFLFLITKNHLSRKLSLFLFSHFLCGRFWLNHIHYLINFFFFDCVHIERFSILCFSINLIASHKFLTNTNILSIY